MLIYAAKNKNFSEIKFYDWNKYETNRKIINFKKKYRKKQKTNYVRETIPTGVSYSVIGNVSCNIDL